MTLEHAKIGVAGGWLLGWAAIALSVDPSSAIGWALLVGSGLLPPLMLSRMWNPPAQTLSESIRNVLR
jgi:hypothetical protein